MMSLPYTLLPTLILTDTPTPLPLSADQMVMPLVAVESATGALPSDVGIVIVAAPDVPQTTIATLRKRYTWQPLMLFTDVDGKSVWEEKYGLLLLPLALWQHLTTPEVLSTYIDMAEMQRLQDIGQSLARTIHSVADPQRQLTHLAEALRHIIPFDGLNMFMMEEDLLRMLFHYGYEDTPGDFKEHMRLPKQYASQLAVMKQGEVKLIADVWHSTEWEPGDKPSLNWIQSWLGIPLWRYGEVVGLIGLDGRVVNQFAPLHASRARYLEETISALVVAIDLEGIIDRSSHLLKAIRRQNQLMSVQFADATSIEGVCRAIAETVVNVFGQTDCGVMLLDDTRTELIRWARAGDYDVQATAPLYLDGDGLAVEAVRSGETIYAPDVDADHRYVPNEPRTRAELAIPLRLHDDIMGVLDLQSTEYHAFTHMDREALTVFADHAATAIENVRLELLAKDYTHQLEQHVADRTRELHAAVKRAETVLNRTSDVIVLLDSEGQIQQTNTAFNRLFGVEPDELFDVCLTTLATEAHRDKLLHTELDNDSNGATITVDVQMKGSGGRVFDAEVTFAPIRASVGAGLEIVCSIRDVTRHKEEKARLHGLLESERQLSDLKSSFIRTVTHEFRTPLTVIYSSMELLRDHYDRMKPERRTKHFVQIATEVRHMEDLLEDALSVQRAQDRRTPFNPEHIDVVKIASTLTSSLNTISKKPQIQLSHAAPTLPLYADETLVRNILRNLLTNAIKYAPGTDTVYCDLVQTETECVIIVRDEGEGIPEDAIGHLFQPFFRANNITAFPGNGLGLSILKDAVDLHNGTIAVESELSKGTTFTVRLPRTTAESK